MQRSISNKQHAIFNLEHAHQTTGGLKSQTCDSTIFDPSATSSNMTNLLKKTAVELEAYMAVSLKDGEPAGFTCPDFHLC